MSKVTISAVWMRQITEGLASIGLNVRELCARAGLDSQRLEQPDARFETETLSRLWGVAVEQTGNPALAMAAASRVRPAGFDVMGYAMMSSPNLLAALEQAQRYSRIVSDTVAGRLVALKEGCRLEIDLDSGSRPAPPQREEFTVLSLLTFCRWIAGKELRPLAVEFRHRAPVDLAPYEAAFRCPLRFGAPATGIAFSSADLALPLLASNPVLAELHSRFAAERVQVLDQAHAIGRARALIVQALPAGAPSCEQVAEKMNMSKRALQRRLQAEGTCFLQLLDDTRRELAERYLASRTASLAEVAYLLGFADQSTFSRASRRWFELPPQRVRDRLRVEGIAAAHY